MSEFQNALFTDDNLYVMHGMNSESEARASLLGSKSEGTTMSQFQNTLFTGDNLYIMHGMNSASVDLIYLDPPFNSKRTYSAPIGSKAAGTSFKDMWSWADVDEACLENMIDNYPYLVQFTKSIEAIHGKPMMSYITFMTQRILEVHRILKPTGSLYLHCDPTASHYLKIVLDRVFGKDNFRNEIVWHYPNRLSQKGFPFPKMHDVILLYSKTDNFVKKEVLDEKWKPSKAQIRRQNRGWEFYKGKLIVYDEKKAIKDGHDLENIEYSKGKTGRKRINSVWIVDMLSSGSKERTGYPTQKPKDLLKRIIEASSNEGDVVFDPFCGCATTCVAAQELNRKWIGIDIEEKAADLVVARLSTEHNIFTDFVHRTDIPQRTDVKIEKPKDAKQRLFEEQKGICTGCKTKMDIRHFHVDHIVPKSKGGGDYYENYQLLCGHCNSIKGDRPMSFLIKKMMKIARARKKTDYPWI